MITLNTADLALSTHVFGCSVEELDNYIEYTVDEKGYIWYKFVDTDLIKVFEHIQMCKREEIPVPVDDFYGAEHRIGYLKKKCNEIKRGI